MIGFIFKFSVTFAISFLLLSFEINNKPIFYHLSKYFGPIGTDIQDSLNTKVQKGLQESKKIGKELFHNADPKILDDQIRSKQSSSLYDSDPENEFILEEIRRDEVRKLDELIRRQ